MTESPSAESRARPAEIIFEGTEAVEGGYDTKALGYSIYTQGENWDDLKEMARDAVLCHFDEDGAPRDPPALRPGGGHRGMKLPRHLSGRRSCPATRPSLRLPRDSERGNPMAVTLTAEGNQQHQVTGPRHRDVRIGKLDAIIADVAAFQDLPKQTVRDTSLIDLMASELKPYPAYRDSGAEWLGTVPAHWETVAVRRYCRVFAGATPNRAVPEYWKGGTIPWLASGDVNLRRVVGARQFITEAGHAASSTKWIRPGSLVLALAGQGRTKGMVATVECRTTCNQSLAAIEPSFRISDHNFLAYYLESRYLDIRSLVGDGLRDGLNLEHVRAISTPVPPISEQAAIVRFLNHVDRRIRRYIRAKQRLIALLEEQRQAIIQRAVTGEIDFRTGQRYATYKSADVEGLKEAPAHWSIVALKRMLTDIVDCEHKTAPAVPESEYHVVRTSAVRGGALDWNGTYRTDSSSYAEWTRRGEPRPGDVVFTREAPAGEACLVPTGRHVCLGQRTVLLRPDPTRYDPSFLIYMIYGGPPKVRVQLASQGSTVGHFNVDDIGWMPVLVPPLTEQQEIVAVLESHDRKVHRARRSLECELKLFHEHHRRLVADVIAGKLDVRDAAAELPEIDPLGTDDTLDGGNATGDGSNPEGEVAASDLDDYGSFARDERGDPGAQRAQP